MATTDSPDRWPAPNTSTADVIAAILSFRRDGTVEQLDAVDLHPRGRVQLHDVPGLGCVLVLGDPDPVDLRPELDRLAGRTTAVEPA